FGEHPVRQECGQHHPRGGGDSDQPVRLRHRRRAGELRHLRGLRAMIASALLALSLAASGTGAEFKALYERGEALYQAGDYLTAVKTFRQADAIRATPEVAFDLAQAYLKLGDKAGTIHAYRLYLRRAPKASDAGEISEKVKTALARE